jgi:hypothetical protein
MLLAFAVCLIENGVISWTQRQWIWTGGCHAYQFVFLKVQVLQALSCMTCRSILCARKQEQFCRERCREPITKKRLHEREKQNYSLKFEIKKEYIWKWNVKMFNEKRKSIADSASTWTFIFKRNFKSTCDTYHSIFILAVLQQNLNWRAILQWYAPNLNNNVFENAVIFFSCFICYFIIIFFWVTRCLAVVRLNVKHFAPKTDRKKN